MPSHYESLSHADLLNLRNAPGADQTTLAPLEHQAFAREFAAESPLLSLALLGAIPAYQVGKGLGLVGSRTGASQPLTQMAAGYRGLGQGLAQASRRGFGALFPQAQAADPAVESARAVGSSPIDRRGPLFGVPPALLSGAGAVPQAPVATPPARSFESDYERELRYLRGPRNSFGAPSINP